MSEHYLRYWWDRSSEVDPAEAAEPHYRVVDNRRRRPQIVQRFDADHKLLSTARVRYRLGRVVRVDLYDGGARLRGYAVCRYTWRGQVRRVETFDAAGQPRVMRLFHRDWFGRLRAVERLTLE